MYDRNQWAQVLLPKSIRRDIREIARSQKMKNWEVVGLALQELKSKQVTTV